MPGVNLSQPITEKQTQEKNSEGTARVAMFSVFVLTCVVWGGIRAGLAWYDKQIATEDGQIAVKKSNMTGDVVNEVGDIEARLDFIKKAGANQTYSQEIFTGLEAAVLPVNRLTLFRYEAEKKTLSIEGVAPGYKEVSQQVMALKASPNFSDVKVISLARERNEINVSATQNVIFSIEMVWNKKINSL